MVMEKRIKENCNQSKHEKKINAMLKTGVKYDIKSIRYFSILASEKGKMFNVFPESNLTSVGANKMCNYLESRFKTLLLFFLSSFFLYFYSICFILPLLPCCVICLFVVSISHLLPPILSFPFPFYLIHAFNVVAYLVYA